MKKEQIIFIRLMSVAGLLAALALLLVFGFGGGLYTDIINNINEGLFEEKFAKNIVHSLYYYKGMDVIYQMLYSLSVFFSVFACIGVVLRKKGAAVFAKLACVLAISTSVYVIISIFAQNSSIFVKMVTQFYAKNINGVVLKNMLGIVPVVIAVITILFSVLALLIIKSSRMSGMKMYAASFKSKAFDIFIPLGFSILFLEIVRIIVMGIVSSNICDSISKQVHGFVTDYYFLDSFLFDTPYVWFVLIAALVAILPNEKVMAKIKSKLLLIMLLVTVFIISIRCIVYLLNSPRLFGYLTINQQICDMTEIAYQLYMMLFMFDVLLIELMTYLSLRTSVGAKKILILCIVSACISICAIVAAAFINILFVYAAAIVADVLTLIGGFYIANISRRNH